MLLEISNLTKSYGEKLAVNNFSAELHEGVYGLLGANGAGKSTLMKILCCLINYDSGSIKFDRKNIKDMKEKYFEILGYLPQKFGYYPNFSGKKFLEYIATIKGINDSEAVDDMLDYVSLTDVKNRKIKTYSGGMIQRLGIACALINNPKILILDEPTSGLDPKERVRFRNLISGLSKDKIIILSTHIVSDIEFISDEIIIIKSGEMLQKGSIDSILERLEGAVWECVLPDSEIDNISQKYSIGSMKTVENGVLVRIISEENIDIPEAKRVAPNLEDLYLFYFSDEKQGEF